MTRLPKRYFKSISDYVKTYYTAYGAKRSQKLYDAVKTVTKDFTRTDPVYVRIGEDGEPEIHYTMTQADGSYYFADMDLGNATICVTNGKLLTSINKMFYSTKAIGGIHVDELPYNTSYFSELFAYAKCRKISIGGSVSAWRYLYSTFRDNSYLVEISLPEDASEITSGDACFYNLPKLKAVPKIGFGTSADISNLISNASSLEAFHAYGMRNSFSLSSATKLTRDALLEVFNNLADLTGKTSATLTIGATLGAKITDEDRKIVTDKNWNLAE